MSELSILGFGEILDILKCNLAFMFLVYLQISIIQYPPLCRYMDMLIITEGKFKKRRGVLMQHLCNINGVHAGLISNFYIFISLLSGEKKERNVQINLTDIFSLNS